MALSILLYHDTPPDVVDHSIIVQKYARRWPELRMNETVERRAIAEGGVSPESLMLYRLPRFLNAVIGFHQVRCSAFPKRLLVTAGTGLS